MKTVKSLPRLTRWMLREVEEGRHDLKDVTMPSRLPKASEISFSLIDIHNAMATFMRSYCLSSLAGAYMTDGSRVQASLAIRGHRSALTFAMRTERPKKTGNGPWKRREEPAWHDPRVIVRVLNGAGCSNAGGVNAALSIGSKAIAHLTTTRNFLAHRNEGTAWKLRRLGSFYGLSLPSDPLGVVFGIGHGRPQRVVDDWLDDLHTIVSLFPR